MCLTLTFEEKVNKCSRSLLANINMNNGWTSEKTSNPFKNSNCQFTIHKHCERKSLIPRYYCFGCYFYRYSLSMQWHKIWTIRMFKCLRVCNFKNSVRNVCYMCLLASYSWFACCFIVVARHRRHYHCMIIVAFKTYVYRNCYCSHFNTNTFIFGFSPVLIFFLCSLFQLILLFLQQRADQWEFLSFFFLLSTFSSFSFQIFAHLFI